MFKNPREFFGLLKVLRREKSTPGTLVIKITGSIVDGKDPATRGDLDLLVVRKGAKSITIRDERTDPKDERSEFIETFTTNPHFLKNDTGEAGALLRNMHKKGRAVFKKKN